MSPRRKSDQMAGANELSGGYNYLRLDEQPEAFQPKLKRLLEFADKTVAHRVEGHSLVRQPEMWERETILATARALRLIAAGMGHPLADVVSDDSQ